ncbi:hypothetical protein OHA98_41160 [Streptomyces sp. NBC_00654]|uniref:hypothetical protein n=1 Tax=Streptomyces sp. NBC_00654 TaxID=2975799 RepID=UPI00225A1E2B|nr:hypothetical protein [Streptomyces sp. NBC_00654]MCX4971026.1 hypothetical protein [Streptomyces sp. NBC_00654]
MAATTAEPTARKRRRKTRTKTVSYLQPLIASEFTAGRIDLTPGKEHVLCPACKTWTQITGVLGTPVLVPHHTTPYHDPTTTPRRRCSNTNRRIVLDTEVKAWQEQLTERTEVSASVATRRAKKVLPKPASPQTERVLRGRDERGPVTRRVEWAGVLYRVRQADQRRGAVPRGAQPAEGPDVPLDHLVPRQAAEQPEQGPLTCERCGATESSLTSAVAAGWCRITHRSHCGRCAGRFPAWTRTSF